MAAVLPVNVLRASQPEKGFVDQGGGLESMAGTFAAEAVSRNSAQIRQEHLEEGGLGL
jgi:hypothetical protein